jgi:hypothetical protein
MYNFTKSSNLFYLANLQEIVITGGLLASQAD